MGTKFGNIHVKTKELSGVLSALKEISSSNIQKRTNPDLALGFESIFEQIDLLQNIYYVGEFHNEWISILNDTFCWGEVEAFGKRLSTYINTPILTIGYFDDDVFEMNIFENGEQKTRQIWCSEGTREDYGLEESHNNISLLAELLGESNRTELNEIMELEDCEEAIEGLQKMMNVPLWIHSDWFSDIDEDETEMTDKYIKYDFNS